VAKNSEQAQDGSPYDSRVRFDKQGMENEFHGRDNTSRHYPISRLNDRLNNPTMKAKLNPHL